MQLFNKTMRSLLWLSLISLAILYCRLAQGQISSVPQFKEQQREEKVFLHTDKELYLAGEILWFKPYLLRSSYKNARDYNRIFYVELLNNAGTPVLQSKTSDKDGGSGNFYLPTDLPTGSYTLIGYTARMKMEKSQRFFKKRIDIVNTLLEPVQKTAERPSVLINLFPESGSLLANVPNTVGIQLLDPVTRKGLSGTGYILADGKDTVSNFSTQKFGLGRVTFTPLPGKKYTASVTSAGKPNPSKSFPDIELSGYSLHVTETANSFHITVNARNVADGSLYLVAHKDHVNTFVKQLPGKSQNNSVTVEKSALGTGVIYFTLFNQIYQPVSERLVFLPGKIDKGNIDIDVEKTMYDRRETAAITVRTADNPDPTALINASLSVFPSDHEESQTPLWMYLHLTSHLSGNIENPEFYFSNEGLSNGYIDNLMLVHGWRRFKAQPVSKSPTMPEYDGHIISATVVDKWSKNMVANMPCFLSVPSVPFGLYFGTSDSAGVVRFNVNGYYGPGDIFITPVPVSVNTKPDYIVNVIDPFIDSSSKAITQAVLFLKEADSTMLLQKSVAMQAANIYSQEHLNRFVVPLIDSLPFFGRPEFSYNLDDYKRFSTMEEVLREYVRPINVVAKGGQLHMSIYDEKNQNIFSDGLLVLLDGVPLFDYNKIFTYNPYKVKKLEVIPRRYVFKSFAFSGIASFETYNSKFDGFELDPGAVAIDYEGLQMQREFYMPDYSQNKGNPRIPDYRSTLLWKPDVSLRGNNTEKIAVSTSDRPGKYRVVIHGVSGEGTPYYGESNFDVK